MRVLAVDLGAESGRVLQGSLENSRFELKEIHRFPNGPIRVEESLRWNLDALRGEISKGIALADQGFASIGVDAWGVDFVLLDGSGNPLGQPYHYRDSRTDGVMERAFQVVPREGIYAQTGIQFLQFNTLYQLYSMVLARDPTLAKATRLLTIPDYFTSLLAESAAGRCEFTNATTTQCFNPMTGAWANDLLERLEIPTAIFPEVVQPGAAVGKLAGGDAKVIATACHDTGSAVAAVPALGSDFAYISSGTWSVMGIETQTPIINEETCAASFTNEGGVEGTFRFCKNVMGLWILQQCRAQWQREGKEQDYAELARQAEAAEPNRDLFDPDDLVFLKPGDMPIRIRQWLEERGLAVPKTQGSLARLVLESLARKYKVVLDELERLSGRKLSRIHVIGGGSQNRLLNQLTAQACRVPVIAGPVEATAIGNILVQLVALGGLGSIEEGRKLVESSIRSVKIGHSCA